MNRQPVSYLQNDPRWKNKPYRVKGESSTIGSAGCGPTSAPVLGAAITAVAFRRGGWRRELAAQGFQAEEAGG